MPDECCHLPLNAISMVWVGKKVCLAFFCMMAPVMLSCLNFIWNNFVRLYCGSCHISMCLKKLTKIDEFLCSHFNIADGLWSFLVLLTFWPNNSLLWGCLKHWKMFSSTPGLYSLEANSGRQLTYSKYPNQSSYG